MGDGVLTPSIPGSQQLPSVRGGGGGLPLPLGLPVSPLHFTGSHILRSTAEALPSPQTLPVHIAMPAMDAI